MTAEAKTNTISSLQPDGSLKQISNARHTRIIKFHDAALGVLSNDLKDVCSTCNLCSGVEDLKSDGSIKLNDGDNKLPKQLKNKCKLLKSPIFVNMDHMATRPV